MARRSSCAVLAALVVVALLCVGAHGLTQGSLYTDCVSSFNKLGGKEGIQKRVPSCSQGFGAIRQCCAEAKSLLNLGPSGCLCDSGVWGEVERQILAANIPNLNSNTLKAFANFCGIPNAGSGTC